MLQRRTDLAAEERLLFSQRSGGAMPEGVRSQKEEQEGIEVETVTVESEAGAQALHKPVGTYVTLGCEALLRREEGALFAGCTVLARQLRRLLPDLKGKCALVAGLGNAAITPDSLGPVARRHVLATRHLLGKGGPLEVLAPAAALDTGVLGDTGMESGEIVRGAVDVIRPGVVIAVDALCARSLSRVCRTVQLSDTGIVPGSGVGNHRRGLTRETLGVPVIAVGAPTVVSAATLTCDLLEEAGRDAPEPEALCGLGDNLFVTPRDIDSQVRELGKMIGLGISLALQPALTLEDLQQLLA